MTGEKQDGPQLERDLNRTALEFVRLVEIAVRQGAEMTTEAEGLSTFRIDLSVDGRNYRVGVTRTRDDELAYEIRNHGPMTEAERKAFAEQIKVAYRSGRIRAKTRKGLYDLLRGQPAKDE